MILNKRLVIICILLCFCIVGCGNDTKVIEKSSSEVQVSLNDTKEIKDIPVTDKIEEKTYKGYVFVLDKIIVEVNAEAKPIIESLGEPISYFESPSCAFEGLDKIYTYNHVEIYTYSESEKDYISSILFKDDLVSTQEGISIGDSLDKVIETYGTEYSEEERILIYSKDDMELCFILNNDVVTSIEYKSTILD